MKNSRAQLIELTKAALFLRETLLQPTDYCALKDTSFVKASSADVYAAINAKQVFS